MVSILITTYNLEKYIEQTLESVISQETEIPVEILVGDDGSEDGTPDIVRQIIDKYPEKNIRLIETPRDKNAKYNRVERSAANRLKLLEEAKGEYCSFLDGDDYYTDKKRIARMTEILDAEENKDCILCAHNLDLAYEDGRRVPLSNAKVERKIDLAEYWRTMFLQSNAVMFRNIYKEHKPEGRLKVSFDDNNIMFWLLRFGKMYYIPKSMGDYRQVEGSSWSAIDLLKRSASNMIGYSVERELAPELRKLSDTRHYPDLKYLYDHKDELKIENLEPFYTTAVDHGITEALDVYRMKGKWIKKSLRNGKAGHMKARCHRALMKAMGKF